MDSFRERYVDSCARMQVEPLQALLDRTNIQKVVALSTTSEGQQDKHSPTITAKDAATAYPSELNLSGQTLSLKVGRHLIGCGPTHRASWLLINTNSLSFRCAARLRTRFKPTKSLPVSISPIRSWATMVRREPVFHPSSLSCIHATFH